MKNKKWISVDTNHMCIFCGKPEEKKWDEYESYYECDCPDAKLDRDITQKINDLELKRPDPKFEYSTQTRLTKIR